MRVVTNEAFIKRNRQWAQFSFLISIAILIGSLFFGNSLVGDNPDAALFMNCLLPPMLFFLILFSVRMSNQWIREPVAWSSIEEGLRGHSSNAVLYHYVMPARHVLISPNGIFVLTPYFQDRPVVVKDDRWRMPGGPVAALMIFLRQEQIGNPTRDAKTEAVFVQRLLNKKFPDNDFEVQPVIVFINPGATVSIEGEPSVPITFVNSDLEPQLKDYLREVKEEDRPTLTKEQIDELEDDLIYTKS